MAEEDERKAQREALRGMEDHIFDLVFDSLPSHRRAEFLQAPLDLAAAKGTLGLVQKLTKAGADTGNALHRAIHGGHRDIVDYLLEIGASPNEDAMVYGSSTPLYAAAGTGSTEIVQLLLLKGKASDIDKVNVQGSTPLSSAVRTGRLTVTKVLLAAGADTSLTYGYRGKSVVHFAVKDHEVPILKALLEHGANANARATDGSTPLHVAAETDNAESISLLVGAGANTEARSESGSTPLHLAASNFNLKVVIALLEHGAAVDAPDGGYRTPLHYAASNAGIPGVAEVVDVLLRSGARERISDVDGNTPMDAIGARIDWMEIQDEEYKRVQDLLSNAFADRLWRRRGFLVLCRAHPDRLCLGTVVAPPGMSSRANTASAGISGCRDGATAGGACTLNERAGGDWGGVAARVVKLEEEGIFQMIVSLL
ncbi:unnamed protein product [Scytosiphon promiscuus]